MSGVVIVAALIAAALLMWKAAIAPIGAPAAASFDAQTKLAGARVVALGDCIVCHTAKGGKPFAGGLPLATPFGTLYATNITPDVETGIGSWSLAAFTRAVRYGVARDGHLLYPAFPYIHFTRMSDHDISAAYAYLMTRDAVEALRLQGFPSHVSGVGRQIVRQHPSRGEVARNLQAGEYGSGREVELIAGR